MSASWKVTLPCTRIEAEAIDDGGELPLDPVPTLMTTEVVLDDAEHWRLDAYFAHEPDAAAIAVVAALAPSAGVAPVVERLADEDWVTLSQAGLEPIVTHWFAIHTSAHPVDPPPGGRALVIDAGRAFGTGHHETTTGCLFMLETLHAEGKRFNRIIDIGTGTGLLAFAANHLWMTAEVTATDIDPVAIDVTRENALRDPEILLGDDVDEITLIVADGALDDAIVARAPYDLVIANILAGPLVSMAPELAAIADKDATVLLAGLLETQREAVVAAYAACGCAAEAVDRRGDWSVLRLRTGTERFVPSAPFDPKGRDGWALDL